MSIATSIMLPATATFTQTRYGDLALLPRAARRLWELVRYHQRLGKEIDRLKDWEWGERLNVGRRCIQKGWKQLELFGYVKRVHEKRRRLIKILVHFPSKSKAAAKEKAATAAAVPAPLLASAEETPVPVSPEEAEAIKAEWAKILRRCKGGYSAGERDHSNPNSKRTGENRSSTGPAEGDAGVLRRPKGGQPTKPPADGRRPAPGRAADAATGMTPSPHRAPRREAAHAPSIRRRPQKIEAGHPASIVLRAHLTFPRRRPPINHSGRTHASK